MTPWLLALAALGIVLLVVPFRHFPTSLPAAAATGGLKGGLAAEDGLAAEERQGGGRRLGGAGADLSFGDALCHDACPDCTWPSSPSKPFDREEDRLLMYSYGKVGTTTLQNSFGPYMGTRVINRNPSAWNAKASCSFHGILPRAIKTHVAHCAAKYLAKVPKGMRVWIVTGTRDPFAWSISNFFQAFKSIKFEWLKWKDLSRYTVQDLDVHVGAELARFSAWKGQWFHSALRNVIDFDLSACSERFANGSLYLERKLLSSQGHVDLSILLLRLEDAHIWESVLQTFMPGFLLGEEKNVAADKDWAPLEKQFEQEWTWPEAAVKRLLLEDTWAFYSLEERDAILRALPRR